MNEFYSFGFIVLLLIVIILIWALYNKIKAYKELEEDFKETCDEYVDTKTWLSIYQNKYSRLIKAIVEHNNYTNKQIVEHYEKGLDFRSAKK